MKIEGFVYLQTPSWGGPQHYGWHAVKMDGCGAPGEYVTVAPCAIEFELPELFSPVSLQVHALREAEKELTKQFKVRVNDLRNQISKLEALEFSGVSA